MTALFLLALVGCDDHVFPAGHGPVEPAGEGWCGVQSVLQGSCVECHSAAGAAGGLDLQTDAHAAMVDVVGAYGVPIVATGDSAGSLLIRKLEGAQASGEGGMMPPTGALPVSTVDLVRAWIDGGADSACDTVPVPPTPVEPPPITGDGWCATQALINVSCAGCHSAGAAAGGLDLQTDPHGALVGATSATYGVPLVTAGDPDGSLFLQKIEGTQGANGGAMPPGRPVEADVAALVRQWIVDGADASCDDAPPPVAGVHPPGWAAPDVHGMAAKFQDQPCQTCHGADLEGDLGPACSSCHGPDWKTTCTYCHGGTDSNTGAPPEDIDDNTNPAFSPFRAHTQHLDVGNHAPIPCETCHQVPTSALSSGHLFVGDTTPGQAEVQFSLLATGGSWNGQTCTVGCHGDGQGQGSIDHAAGPRSCESCHPYTTSDENTWDHMSGEHEEHLDEDVHCSSCHGGTVSAAGTIVGPEQHVDGEVQVQLPTGMTRSGGTCSGTCHGESHNNRSW